MFRTTVMEPRASDIRATIDDVTTPYEPLYVIVAVIVGFPNLSNILLRKTSNKITQPLVWN